MFDALTPRRDNTADTEIRKRRKRSRKNPLPRMRVLEGETKAQTQHTLGYIATVGVGARNFEHTASEASVGVQLQTVNTAAGIGELGRIRPIESFGAELEVLSFGHREPPEQTEIRVECARST